MTASTSEAAAVDHPASVVEPTARRGSPVALFSGLVLGAIIGAGSAAAVYALMPGAHQPANNDAAAVASLGSRVDALEKRPDPDAAVQQLRQQVASLRQNSSANEAASDKGDPQLEQKLASLQAEVDALQKGPNRDASASDTAGQTKALDGLQSSVAAAQHQASTAQSDVSALAAQQKDLAAKLATVQAALGATKTEASSARTEVGAMQSQQKALEARVSAPMLAVIADSLVEQVDAGKPYQRQVDAMSGLNADPAKLAVLKENAATGVPSAQALLAQFKPLSNAIVATGSHLPAGTSFVQRLRSGLTGLVSVRRDGATGGTDLRSRVATIEADLVHNDVSGAYGVWKALPDAAKQASQNWGSRAKTSVEAITAARDLRGNAIDALGGKRS